MSKNRRVPQEFQKYLVLITESSRSAHVEEYHYFQNQKKAKAWAKAYKAKSPDRKVKKLLFKVICDFYEELK